MVYWCGRHISFQKMARTWWLVSHHRYAGYTAHQAHRTPSALTWPAFMLLSLAPLAVGIVAYLLAPIP